MARTTKDRRSHYIGVRLTEGEYQALSLLARQRGNNLSDTLRALIPRVQLVPGEETPAEVVSAMKRRNSSIRRGKPRDPRKA